MLKSAKNTKFVDVEALKKRFLLLNKERLRRAEDCMRVTQRDFLEFLPLLFHINHPRLPGYESKDTPSGICDYSPTQKALGAANRYINRFDYKKRAMPRYDILSMFLMGSSGTVAYSKNSDFDIWLCHQHELSRDKLDELQAKATAIEAWADEQGLEVHFFLMDAKTFKAGKIVDLSSESSGTAQYYLLLEEFYRTGLLLAGRYPAWWLVPVEHEANYDAYLSGLYERRIVHEGECIDFGGIPTIPAEEFFGAALWQLFKGIDSPYKSVLKLLLMEVYASEYPNIGLLCLDFKKSIYEGEIDLDRLDPYLMLYRRLERYLLDRDEEGRLALVRRCFYFKVNQKMSRPESTVYDWRRDLLRGLLNAWGWEQEYLEVMDDRSGWKIRQVLKERGVLVKELTYTYHFLSDFARQHAELAAINQQDLNALGRKLYAAFERKAGKVEVVNRGISLNVWESSLALYQIRQKGDGGGWALLSPEENEDSSKMTALKRGRHVIEVIAWAYFNGLMNASTVIKVISNDSQLVAQEVEEFVRDLERILPTSKLMQSSVESLGRSAKVQQSVVVVNMGRDPLIEHRRSGKYLASNRTDAFSYGGMYESLVSSFDLVTINSWKEVITSHCEGIDNILTGISLYFKAMPPSKGNPPPMPKVLCYTSNHKVTIQQRIERLFNELAECFYGAPGKKNNRYIMNVKSDYYVMYIDDDVLRYQYISSYPELLRYLGKGRQSFGQVVIDRSALQDTLLPLIFKFNRPGIVQLFFKDKGKVADVYVLDENGSLFFNEMEFVDGELLLGQFSRFFDAILQRRFYQQVGGEGGVEVNYYQLTRNHQGAWQVGKRDGATGSGRKGYTNLQVIAASDDDKASFVIYCDDQEFSSVEHGAKLFSEVAAYILRRRRSGQPYPIFVTDVDLPPSLLEQYSDSMAPTADFLNYKKSIEATLNEALKNISSKGTPQPLTPPG